MASNTHLLCTQAAPTLPIVKLGRTAWWWYLPRPCVQLSSSGTTRSSCLMDRIPHKHSCIIHCRHKQSCVGPIPLHLPNRILCVTIPFPKNCADFEIRIIRHAVHHSMIPTRFLGHTGARRACFPASNTRTKGICTHVCRRSDCCGCLTAQHTPRADPSASDRPQTKGKHSTTRAHLCMRTCQKGGGAEDTTFVGVTLRVMCTNHTHTHTHQLTAPRRTQRRMGHLRTQGAHLHSHAAAPKENCSIQDSHVVPHRSTN